MPTHTVHAPPLRDGEAASDPERFVFVRDGFYFWAFVLAPVWLLVRRLWLVFVLYALFSGALAFVFELFGVPSWARFVAGVLVGLLIGFEAATLWRWTLTRRGWRVLGSAVGDDIEGAERRFFAAWTERERAQPPKPAAAAPAPSPVRRVTNPDVIGLFPEPGGSR